MKIIIVAPFFFSLCTLIVLFMVESIFFTITSPSPVPYRLDVWKGLTVLRLSCRIRLSLTYIMISRAFFSSLRLIVGDFTEERASAALVTRLRRIW
jgi:ABC-type glucose/galactose transport system permease subunit